MFILGAVQVGFNPFRSHPLPFYLPPPLIFISPPILFLTKTLVKLSLFILSLRFFIFRKFRLIRILKLADGRFCQSEFPILFIGNYANFYYWLLKRYKTLRRKPCISVTYLVLNSHIPTPDYNINFLSIFDSLYLNCKELHCL